MNSHAFLTQSRPRHNAEHHRLIRLSFSAIFLVVPQASLLLVATTAALMS
jgi:hypothetical protein